MMKIKINDLLTGDLIKVRMSEDKPFRFAVVTGLLESNSSEASAVEIKYTDNGIAASITEDCCYGVELTEELLMLIGFDHCTDKDGYLMINDKQTYAYSPSEKNFLVHGEYYISLFDIVYVHQIQRHLALTGSKKLNGLIQKIVCDDGVLTVKQSKRYKLPNRYKDAVYLEVTDEEDVYLLIVDKESYMTISYFDNDSLYSVDPSGGPYMSIGGSVYGKSDAGEDFYGHIKEIYKKENKYFLKIKLED